MSLNLFLSIFFFAIGFFHFPITAHRSIIKKQLLFKFQTIGYGKLKIAAGKVKITEGRIKIFFIIFFPPSCLIIYVLKRLENV